MPAPFDPQKHHRRSIRLKDYDYAQAGAYFVTVVTLGRECLFGEIINGEMILNGLSRNGGMIFPRIFRALKLWRLW